jgi:uncharacterized protein YecE (DUF72 family)
MLTLLETRKLSLSAYPLSRQPTVHRLAPLIDSGRLDALHDAAKLQVSIQQGMSVIRIGTAGWNIAAAQAEHFEACGTHLQRYASRMNCCEVNSSFYRTHQRKIWQRWASATPSEFRFAVKAPNTITHAAKLLNCGSLLVQFFEQVSGLGEKLGPVLIQLAPRYAFDPGVVRDFLGTLREVHTGLVALEPRNATWFTPQASQLLREFNISRVAADPPKGSPVAATPAGDYCLQYYLLHGSPRVYWSPYDSDQLEALAAQLRANHLGQNWVIFDNTAAGEALKNALALQALIPT